VGYLSDLRKKIDRARRVVGPSYIHVHTPCPTGWFFDPSKTIEIAKAAVQTRAWMLYEIENGQRRMTVKASKRRPVSEYVKLQGRFDHLSADEIDALQEQIDAQADMLLKAQELDHE
jgi:pyruvate/2-oxoacid:ferredoxin oxidoreductase beta subunit